MFALGIYLAVDGGDLNFITGNQVIGGAALFIIVGAVAMVITIVCIFGAIFKWRPILVLVSAAAKSPTQTQLNLLFSLPPSTL